MKILVTGGAGFIGSHLTIKLIQLGFNVRVFDNFSTGKRKNIINIIKDLDVIVGDIRDRDLLSKALVGVNTVFHLAAIPSVSLSVSNPIETHDVNINGTLNLLQTAKEQDVNRIIFSSSCAVYGENTDLPIIEESILDPKSPYAISKIAGEYYCNVFYDLYHLETISLRYFNVFGPKQDPATEYSAVIPKFMTSILNKQNPTIYGDGKQTRDFVYVGNIVNANILAMNCRKGIGDVFNIAGQKQINLIKLIKQLERITGTTITTNYLPKRQEDILHSYANISKSKDILGYEPVFDLYDGLEKTYKYFLDNPYI